MGLTRKSVVIAFATLLLISTLTGVIFYRTVVGANSTNILSVLFGWQWIYLSITGLIILLIALVTKRKKLVIAAGIMLVTLAIPLVSARIIESNRLYITGEGGPAGPTFACLVWDNSAAILRSGVYSDSLGLCTLMSIPSYNKFLIDRSREADQGDVSASYYLMAGIHQLVIIGGFLLATRSLVAKNISRS